MAIHPPPGYTQKVKPPAGFTEQVAPPSANKPPAGFTERVAPPAGFTESAAPPPGPKQPWSIGPIDEPVPVPHPQWAEWINKYAGENGIDPLLLASLLQHESSWNPRASSPAGAKGLAQFIDSTGKGYGVKDPFDPEQSIRGAAGYLAHLIRRYPGELSSALAAYNSGEGAVDKYKGMPPYDETKKYVSQIMGTYELARKRQQEVHQKPPAPPLRGLELKPYPAPGLKPPSTVGDALSGYAPGYDIRPEMTSEQLGKIHAEIQRWQALQRSHETARSSSFYHHRPEQPLPALSPAAQMVLDQDRRAAHSTLEKIGAYFDLPTYDYLGAVIVGEVPQFKKAFHESLDTAAVRKHGPAGDSAHVVQMQNRWGMGSQYVLKKMAAGQIDTAAVRRILAIAANVHPVLASAADVRLLGMTDEELKKNVKIVGQRFLDHPGQYSALSFIAELINPSNLILGEAGGVAGRVVGGGVRAAERIPHVGPVVRGVRHTLSNDRFIGMREGAGPAGEFWQRGLIGDQRRAENAPWDEAEKLYHQTTQRQQQDATIIAQLQKQSDERLHDLRQRLNESRSGDAPRVTKLLDEELKRRGLAPYVPGGEPPKPPPPPAPGPHAPPPKPPPPKPAAPSAAHPPTEPMGTVAEAKMKANVARLSDAELKKNAAMWRKQRSARSQRLAALADEEIRNRVLRAGAAAAKPPAGFTERVAPPMPTRTSKRFDNPPETDVEPRRAAARTPEPEVIRPSTPPVEAPAAPTQTGVEPAGARPEIQERSLNEESLRSVAAHEPDTAVRTSQTTTPSDHVPAEIEAHAYDEHGQPARSSETAPAPTDVAPLAEHDENARLAEQILRDRGEEPPPPPPSESKPSPDTTYSDPSPGPLDRGGERGFVQIPKVVSRLRRTPNDPDLRRIGAEAQENINARRDELLKRDPLLIRRMYGGRGKEDWFPQSDIWSDKDEFADAFLGPPPGSRGSGPIKTRGRVYENIPEGVAAGENINPEWMAFEHYVEDQRAKGRYIALLDSIDRLKFVRTLKDNKPMLQEGRFRFAYDPGRSRLYVSEAEAVRKGLPIRDLGTGLIGYKRAMRIVRRDAMNQAIAVIRRKHPNYTKEQVLAAAKKIMDPIVKKLQRMMFGVVRPEGYIADAAEFLRLPTLRGKFIHREAVSAIRDARPDLFGDLTGAIRDWVNSDSSAARAAGVVLGPTADNLGRISSSELAQRFMRFIDNTNAMARQTIVANPVVHPVWNLGIQSLAENPAGIAEILQAWNPAYKIDQVWEDAARQYHLDPEFGAHPFHLDPHTDARLATVPSKSITDLDTAPLSELYRESVDQAMKAAIKISSANKRLVFGVMEHRIATQLFKSLVKDLSNPAMDPMEAAIRVRKALGDYDNITKADRAVSRLFFFYPWMKTVMRYWASKGLRQPQWWNAPMQYAQTKNKAENAPSLSNPFAAAEGVDKLGDQRYVTPLLPQRYVSTMADMVLSPLFGYGLEKPIRATEGVWFNHANPILRSGFDVEATVNKQPQRPNAINRVLFDVDAPIETQLGQLGGSLLGNSIFEAGMAQDIGRDPATALRLTGVNVFSVPDKAKAAALSRTEKTLRKMARDARDRGDLDAFRDAMRQLYEIQDQLYSEEDQAKIYGQPVPTEAP